MLNKLFKLAENKTTVRTEIIAGLTTFMTMAYILAVNPSILSEAGMPRGGVFIATAIASVVGTLLMAFMSNYPFVLAPGMGLNAFLTFTVVLTMGFKAREEILKGYDVDSLFSSRPIIASTAFFASKSS